MDSELLLTFIRYLPDYLSALSRTLLRFFFFFGQPLSKQLYTIMLLTLLTFHHKSNLHCTIKRYLDNNPSTHSTFYFYL